VKKIIPVLLAVLAVFQAGRLLALENHVDYRTMKPNECNECHGEEGVAPNHQAGWNADHRRFAGKPESGTNCSHCHDQSFCADCHFGGGINADLHVPKSGDGRDFMPRSHRTDFRETHPVQAAENPASCNRCHPTSYCTDCHRQYQPADLAFQSHRRGFSDLQVSAVGPKHATYSESSCRSCHPNSLLPTHRWTSSHRQEARRNLSACQACHPDGDVCMKCHSARSGLRVKIHPGNWSSIKGKLERASGKRSCNKCHDVIPW
jgi:hypothetical protein